MSNPGSSPEKNDFKSLLAKGMIGAVTLAGTTAIPIVVQQSLQRTSTPTASPSATVPAQVSPTPAAIASPVQTFPSPDVPAQISPTPAALTAPVQVSPSPDVPQMHPAEATYQVISQDANNDKPGKKGKKKHKDD